jgi:hypothetical protein
MIATCLVVILACLSLVGIVYVQSGHAATQTALANQKLADALALAQITNNTMLIKLSEMSEAIRHPRSPEWNPLKFIITENTADGPPGSGCSVAISQVGFNNAEISRTSDGSGVADFGLVHPGEYSVTIMTTSARPTLQGFGRLSVDPGEPGHRAGCLPPQVVRARAGAGQMRVACRS